jgi:hypothetical protein
MFSASQPSSSVTRSLCKRKQVERQPSRHGVGSDRRALSNERNTSGIEPYATAYGETRGSRFLPRDADPSPSYQAVYETLWQKHDASRAEHLLLARRRGTHVNSRRGTIGGSFCLFAYGPAVRRNRDISTRIDGERLPKPRRVRCDHKCGQDNRLSDGKTIKFR